MDKVSTSVDVLFKIVDPSEFIERTNASKINNEKELFIPIWTTTPWTLPSNEAVAMGEDILYGIYSLTLHERRYSCRCCPNSEKVLRKDGAYQ